MRTALRILSVLALALLSAPSVGAFVAPTRVPACPVIVAHLPTSFVAPTPLYAVKKPKEEKEGVSAELILRWISPANPYMWFIYMFAFIIGADFFKHL